MSSEENHELASKFLYDLTTSSNAGGVWISKFVVAEVMNRIIGLKPNIGDKKGVIAKVWNELHSENIFNEDNIEEDQVRRIYKNAYKIMHKHASNNKAPSFVDCYLVSLANRLNKKFRTDIKIAYFDQYFPTGKYTAVFNQ